LPHRVIEKIVNDYWPQLDLSLPQTYKMLLSQHFIPKQKVLTKTLLSVHYVRTSWLYYFAFIEKKYPLCSVELSDDRNDSYLTALRQGTTAQTQMVMCIVPTNKKDRYDAIKKFTCVDHPGKSVQITLLSEELNKCCFCQ